MLAENTVTMLLRVYADRNTHQVRGRGFKGHFLSAERGGRMTREEAISNLRGMMGGMPFDKCFDWIVACSVAIQSLEAWDEVIKHLESTAKELLDRADEKQSHAFAKGITFAVSMIKNFLKEVEE